MTARILAIDIGTSSTKGLLVDDRGQIQATHQVCYPLLSPQPDYAEQDPSQILAAVREVIETVAPRGVDLVFGCAMHSVIGVDVIGAALSPVLTWADRRATRIASELRTQDRARGLHARTGTPIHPMSPLCKIRHISRHDTDLFCRVDRFVSIKEFVIESLTGERCVDHSVASSTGLFDVARLQWDREALEFAGIDAGRLSPLVPTTHVIDDPSSERRIVVGATDGVLANLGAGDADATALCVTLGTSGAARLLVDGPMTDPEGRLFCYVLDAGRWVIGGAINNGGLVLGWLQNEFPDEARTHDEIISRASKAVAGADGLLCVPAVAGERYPTYDPRAVVTLSGGRESRTPDLTMRAALEGMMLPFAPLIDEVEEASGAGSLQEVRIGGGIFEWEFCRQLLADVIGRRVAMSDSRESSALGGARLGFQALGVGHGWSHETTFSHTPDSDAHAVYRGLLGRRDDLARPVR